MTRESTERTGRFWIVTIALFGAIPLSCVAILVALLILLFSDDPRVSARGYLELSSMVLGGCLALAWFPLLAASTLYNRGKLQWAYVFASIPPALLAFLGVLFVIWH